MTGTRLAARVARLCSLVVVAALGTISLMRFAPGYFADIRELDGQHAQGVRDAIKLQQAQQGSVTDLTRSVVRGWSQGDLGRSRQFDVPVKELLRSRVQVTAKLVVCGVACGWMLAIGFGLPLSARRSPSGDVLIAGITAVFLAIPVGAMSTICLLAGVGGPLAVLTTLIGVRDFKLLYRLLRSMWQSPHLLQARAQGIRPHRIARVHVLPNLSAELLALATTSFIIALSAVVPVEVVFNVPGLGQLAWSAAMNRDLPVLLAVTLIMAMCIGVASTLAKSTHRIETAQCG